MHSSPFSRMLWKETRELFPLAGALVLGSAGLQLVIALVSTNSTSAFSTRVLAGIPTVLCAAFAVAAGAMMFAGEKEAETIDLLRRLPISPGFVTRSKFAAAVLGTFLLAMILTPMTVVFVVWKGNLSDLTSRDWAWESLEAILVFLHLLLWGVFFSILTGKVLRSIFLSVFATVIARLAYPYDSIILGIVLLAIYFLKTRWFYDLSLFAGILPAISVSISLPRMSRSFSSEYVERGTPESRERGRLLWLEFQRSQGLLICLVAAFTFWGVSLLVAETTLRANLTPNAYANDVLGPLVGIPAYLLTLGVLIAGISVFSSDQQQSAYRFLSERGVTPGMLFRGKLLVWGTLGLILPVVLFASFFKVFGTLRQQLVSHPIPFNLLIGSILVLCIAFTSGLLTSLVFRSRFVAFGISLISLLMSLYLYAMTAPEPDAFPVILVSIPFILLVAARYRVRDWLLERNRFRHWLNFNAVLWIPLSLSLISGPIYRIYSIPYVEPQQYSLTQRDLDRGNPEERKLVAEVAIEIRCLGDVPSEVRVSEFSIHPGSPFSSPKNSWKWGNPYGEWRAPLSAAERGWDKGLPLEKVWLEKNHFWLSNDQVLEKEAEHLATGLFTYPLQRVFPNPARLMDLAYLHHLMGSRLASEGKLREGLQHHLRAIQIAGLRWRIPDSFPQRNSLEDVYHRVWESEFITAWSYRWIHTWSLHPQQTKEILADAIPRLEKVVQYLPSPSMSSQLLAQSLEDELNADVEGLFWERERVKRIAALAIRRDVQMGVIGDRSVVRGRVVYAPPRDELLLQNSSRQTLEAVENYEVFLPEAWHEVNGVGNIELFASTCRECWDLCDSRISRLQMLDLSLALNAWRIENGSFPTTLQPLVGPYFDELPQVAFTFFRDNVRPISYYPTGLEDELDLLTRNPPNLYQTEVPVLRLPRNIPFLISSSSGQTSFVPYETEGDRALKIFPGGQWLDKGSTTFGVGQYSSFFFLPLVPTDLIQVPSREQSIQPGTVTPARAGGMQKTDDFIN